MTVVLNIVLIIATFFAMEFMAWFTHKYVMHGFMWKFHKDHHVEEPGFFERNDVFFLIYAVPSFLLILFGAKAGYDFRFFIGLGILFYGMAYFFVHDIFIHQRFKILRNADHPYFKAIRKAHKVHHKHRGKEHGECFGMLLVPWKYFREALKAERRQQAQSS